MNKNVMMDSKASIIMKLLVVAVLIVVLFVEQNEVEGSRSLSKEEDLELEQQLKILNKPFVKSIKIKSGDIIDCVDIYKQPAFDHPLLKNHKIQMNPSFIPQETEVNKAPSNMEFAKTDFELQSERCPLGTVPIRRTKKEELINSKRLRSDGNKLFSGWKYLHEMLTLEEKKVHSGVYGAKAIMSLWNPAVEDDQFTQSQFWVQNGPGYRVNSIEAGWTVNPVLFGDKQTRLFSFWTADGNHKTGCYNALCPGYVQVGQVPMGSTFGRTSEYGGDQFGIMLKVARDSSTGNWWLMLNDDNNKIGYWPKELFTDLSENATAIKFGGLGVYSPERLYPPQMGSGFFPDNNYRRTAYMSNMTIVEPNGDAVDWDANYYGISETTVNCYKLDFMWYSTELRYSMMYGGPGGPRCL